MTYFFKNIKKWIENNRKLTNLFFYLFLSVCLLFSVYVIRKDLLVTAELNKGFFYFICPLIIIFLIIISFKKEKWTKGDVLVSFSVLITVSFFLFQTTYLKISKLNAIQAVDKQNCKVIKAIKDSEGKNLEQNYNLL